MPDESDSLDVIAVLRTEIEGLPPAARPFGIAQLERQAAERYREWADETKDAVLAVGLRTCATREECIAEMIEISFPSPPEAATALREALARITDQLADRFTGMDASEAYASQSAAERVGGTSAPCRVWGPLERHPRPATAPKRRRTSRTSRCEPRTRGP